MEVASLSEWCPSGVQAFRFEPSLCLASPASAAASRDNKECPSSLVVRQDGRYDALGALDYASSESCGQQVLTNRGCNRLHNNERAAAYERKLPPF